MTQWRPISEAPKDGAPVLIWRFTCTPMIARWNAQTGWMVIWNEGENYTSPTHWMPLPPAPEVKGDA
jgi:hypothetical protein